MTKQLSSETVDTVDNGTKTSVENVVENAAKSKVETGTNKHERNRRRSSDFDEEDWQEKGKVNAAKVHFYLEGNRKFFIEIKFKKDVTVFKKGEKEPVGDNERRNIDDEFK